MNKLISFYVSGFKEMTTGRQLWIIILVKLAVIFLVIKLVFFPGFLSTRFNNNNDRSNYVINQLTKIKK